jgi:peroxiredoxin
MEDRKMNSELEDQVKDAEKEWIEGWKRGPQRLRWSEIPLQVGDRAPDFELPDSSGRLVKLSTYWKDRPALVLFWRHYGCGCGIDRAAMLKKEFSAYREAGANVLIIGQGEPERATAYAQKYELRDLPILCDPEFSSYEAYGLVEGKQRRKLGRPLVDNSWLLPGEFVIDTSGTVRLAYRYNYCEDFPDYRVLTAAIREARLGSS